MVRHIGKVFLCVGLIVSVIIPLSWMIVGNQPISGNQNMQSDLSPSNEDFLEDLDLSGLPPINYTTLNEEWYEPKINMLIITPNQTFSDAVEPLKEWKNEKGVKTKILDNDDFSKYSGEDKAEKIRNMIKDYYETEDIEWVLLAGDAEDSLIPIRYV
ncbi:MAG: C25 family cysteine peptidase, partial [Promethearchaeia archaeon]